MINLQSMKVVWTGMVLSVLAAFPLIFSGLMKLKVSPELEQGFAHMPFWHTFASEKAFSFR